MKKLCIFLGVSWVMISAPCISNEISGIEMLQYAQDITIPEKISLERFSTLNGYGYIFHIISPLAQQFINDAGPQKRFLEIGAGFSKITQECLRKGIFEYTANDLSLEHLKIMCKELENAFGSKTAEYLKHLKFLPGRVPEVLEAKENYYEGILLDKVLHFLSPQESELFFAWAHKALKIHGKLYIFTISPFCKGFKVDTLYKKQKEETIFYPGYIKNLHAHLSVSNLNHPNYSVPDSMLFFMRDDLKALLESKNFTIQTILTTRLPNEQAPSWVEVEEDKCDLVGMVAQKN